MEAFTAISVWVSTLIVLLELRKVRNEMKKEFDENSRDAPENFLE